MLQHILIPDVSDSHREALSHPCLFGSWPRQGSARYLSTCRGTKYRRALLAWRCKKLKRHHPRTRSPTKHQHRTIPEGRRKLPGSCFALLWGTCSPRDLAPACTPYPSHWIEAALAISFLRCRCPATCARICYFARRFHKPQDSLDTSTDLDSSHADQQDCDAHSAQTTLAWGTSNTKDLYPGEARLTWNVARASKIQPLGPQGMSELMTT